MCFGFEKYINWARHHDESSVGQIPHLHTRPPGRLIAIPPPCPPQHHRSANLIYHTTTIYPTTTEPRSLSLFQLRSTTYSSLLSPPPTVDKMLDFDITHYNESRLQMDAEFSKLAECVPILSPSRRRLIPLLSVPPQENDYLFNELWYQNFDDAMAKFMSLEYVKFPLQY